DLDEVSGIFSCPAANAATCCRPPRKPTHNDAASDGDCCDSGSDDSGGNNGDGNDGSGDDELQRRRAVHFSTPGQKSPKQNRTHGPSAVKHSKPAGFRDLKTLPENFAALRHGTFFHPPVAHKFRRQPIAARVLHAVKAMEERRFGKLSESGDMN
ncbi:hypothetical protein, partial [Alistipes finegoldii]|uniref:hypothetical protein n=1 Tax=Alistipes finegoldii TaxID=214856 RepID=UPI00256F2EA1